MIRSWYICRKYHFWPKFALFTKFRGNKFFFQKSGFVTFFQLWSCTFMQKIKKIGWVVPEKNASQTDGCTYVRTNRRTDEWNIGADFIGPFRKAGVQKLTLFCLFQPAFTSNKCHIGNIIYINDIFWFSLF